MANTKYGRGTAHSTHGATPPAEKGGTTGHSVCRGGLGRCLDDQSNACHTDREHHRAYDEPNKPDGARSDQWGLKGGNKENLEKRIRIGTANVGTMRGRSGEIVDMAGRRRLDFCCLQETRWKGGSSRMMGEDGKRYKFVWIGNHKGEAGVGVLVAERWLEKMIEVKRVSDRIIVLRLLLGKSILNLISVYAPQVGRPNLEKEEFWTTLTMIVSSVKRDEEIFLGGDMNGHVGREVEGFEDVHGGHGYGERNREGEMLLEFASATGLILLNTLFQKEKEKKVTYASGDVETVIDYVLTRRSNKKSVQDVKVIPGEECLTQHRLLIACLRIDGGRTKPKPIESSKRLRVWRLRDRIHQDKFKDQLLLREDASTQKDRGVDEMWTELKDSLLAATEKVCGQTTVRRQRKGTWWWNDDIAQLIKSKRNLYKIWHRSKNASDKFAYQEAKRTARRAVSEAQSKTRSTLVESLDNAEGKGQIFKLVKQMVRKNKDLSVNDWVKNKDGIVARDSDEIKKIWKDYYDKLLNEEFSWDRETLDECRMMPGPILNISEAEVTAALNEMKVGKASGPSGVVTEMLKAAGGIGICWMTDLFNRILADGKMPMDWKLSWMTSIYKGKGDALDCGSYRGIKLLEHAMKVFERVMEKRLRKVVNIDDMQCGFRPGRGTTDAIFIVRQLQEKYLEKKRELWMAFIDLEKAFDRVPREILWWSLRKLNVPEWLVAVVKLMYDGVQTAVKTSQGVGDEFEVRVGVHQGSVLSPLLFTIVLEAISKQSRDGLPWEILYADDLVLMAESEEQLLSKIKIWKDSLESKGLKVNVAKTKVMKCGLGLKQSEECGRWPCGVCRKGVGRNSIQCHACKKWIHKKCSGIKGRLVEGMKFSCGTCRNKLSKKVGPEKVGENDVVMLQDAVFEKVDKFCYLGDMIGAGGGAEDAVRLRVRLAWSKFMELAPILTVRGASLRMKGKIYGACVRSVMVYGSATWPMRVEDGLRLERAENMMVRMMCGVKLKDRLSSEDLRKRLGIGSVTNFVKRGRLGWFGHVERKAGDDWVRTCQGMVVDGCRGRGRGRKTWLQCVNDDLKDFGLKREDAMDRMIWRSKVFEGPVLPAHARKCRR